MMNATKVWKKVNHIKKKNIAERVKLRRWKADDEGFSGMPPLEDNDEEVKEGKGLKFLTPNKLTIRFLTPNKLIIRLPILLAQRTWKHLIQIKNEIRQIIYLLYQHNKITKKVYNNLIKSL